MNKGIFFLLATIGLCLSVVLFNFFMDPYHVFLRTNTLYFQIPRAFININLKADKNVKNDTFLIGGSEVSTLFSLSYNDAFFNKIGFNKFSFENQYDMLKNYLFLHPETKKVIIVVNYSTLLHEPGIPVMELKEKYYTSKDFVFLLFCRSTTKYSLKVFKNIIEEFKADDNKFDYVFHRKSLKNNKNKKRFYPYNNKGIYPDVTNNIRNIANNSLDTTYSYEVYPEGFPNIVLFEKKFREYYDPNIIYLEKMVNLLKERNIDYIFIIPPHHCLYQTIIYRMPEMQNAVWDLKRLLVKLSDNDVYDFSIINDDTTCDYEDNYYFHDIVHGNYILGAKILEVLYYGLYDKNLYLKLNKKNIDKQLQYEDKLLRDYCKNNKNLLKKYDVFFNNSLKLNINKKYRKKILYDKPEIFREIQFMNNHLFM